MSASLRIEDFADAVFDPFKEFEHAVGADTVADPYPRLEEMRRAGPVHAGNYREMFGLADVSVWSDMPSYVVLGYDVAREVLSDPVRFSNRLLVRLYDFGFGAQNIHAMDPPEHSRFRTLFQKAFMPRAVANWHEQLLPAVIDQFIDGFATRGQAELVTQFTQHYPFHFIFGQLALPREDQYTFHKLAVALLCLSKPHLMGEASVKLGCYLKSLLEARRQQHGEDLISLLAQAEVDGERIPDEVAVSFIRQLLTAGGGTTFHATGSLLTGLLTNPQQLDAVRKDRSLVDQTIEEALRWASPSVIAMRMTTADTVLGGVEMPKRSRIEVLLGAANRDPAYFDAGHQFDIFRPRHAHLAFSQGPHICIGRHLAKMEMTCALNALLDRLPNLRLDPRYPAPSVRGLITRTPDAIHVRFDPS